MILFYDIIVHIPYIIIPDWFISVWLIVGGIGILVQQFSIPLTGDIFKYNRVALKTTPIGIAVIAIAYIAMLIFPPISYIVAFKCWSKNK